MTPPVAFNERCAKCNTLGTHVVVFELDKTKPYNGCTYCDKMLREAEDLHKVPDYHIDKQGKSREHNSKGSILGYERRISYLCHKCVH